MTFIYVGILNLIMKAINSHTHILEKQNKTIIYLLNYGAN